MSVQFDLDVPADARALVVLIHGAGASKDWGFFPWLAQNFVEERFAVCRFNLSQPSDLRLAVEHAQSSLNLPTFLLGHAGGGGIAVLGAAGVRNLHGVITWSAIVDDDVLRAASQLEVPLLTISGGKDDASSRLAAKADDKAWIRIATADQNFNATDPMGDPPFVLDMAISISCRFIAAHVE